MMSLPDIYTSASFWASVATIEAAAGAWISFWSTVKASRKQAYDSVLNLLTGIEAELDLVSAWASGEEGSHGYLQSKTQQDLVNEHSDWFFPTRQIFTFDYPLLQTVTTYTQLRDLTPIVQPLVFLNDALRKVFDLHAELRTFANSHPALFDSVSKKLSKTPNTFTTDEQVYMNLIFGLNKRIHHDFIGGADSTNERCLYKAFRKAKTAVAQFKNTFKPEPLPRWYVVLHVASALLALNGLWQMARWFRIL